MNRALVTGMGALCSLGNSVPAFLQALRQRKSGLVYEDIYGYPTALGRVGPEFATADLVGDATHDRATLMALDVAHQAMTNANMDGGQGDRAGVFWGVGHCLMCHVQCHQGGTIMRGVAH